MLLVSNAMKPRSTFAPAFESVSSTPVSGVPLLDVGRANREVRDEVLAAIAAVFDSGKFLFGPDVTELEKQVASRAQARHAIGCASGSDALLLALMALNVGCGDEVIVPSFTFFATASAVWRVGARIVFADIDPQTFNIDPKHVESLITSRTKAVIPVHLYGRCADLTALGQITARQGIPLIEDAAQSIGAAHEGRPAGTHGAIGCFSFYPTKNLGGCGDGGLLTANDDQLADQLRLFAAHGMRPRYYHQVVGINSRLDTFQAAALCVKLRHLDDWTRQRQINAARYEELFAAARLQGQITTPDDDNRGFHVWNQYTIRVHQGRRDTLRQALQQAGVGTEVYYPLPLHRQACFASLGYSEGSLPATERAAEEVLSLPNFPGLTANEQQFVVAQIAACLQQKQSLAA
jgi:dTDP-4-amino-4,6-dideoxygalactose transaminase